MLLQVPEQRESAENEIRTHHLVKHKNIIRLVNSEIKDERNGSGVALLVFPFYRVSQEIALQVEYHWNNPFFHIEWNITGSFGPCL